MDDDHGHEAADDATTRRADRARARAFRISDRLNRISKIYLGPAQFGGFRPGGTEVKPLSDRPCPACSAPMSQHDLVHSDNGRQRFYCPDNRQADETPHT